jgi:hypothetical protein
MKRFIVRQAHYERCEKPDSTEVELNQRAKSGKSGAFSQGAVLRRTEITGKDSRLAAMKKRTIIKGNPEDLVHFDWSSCWRP